MNENLSRNLQEHVFSFLFFFLRCDQKQFKHFLRMFFKVKYCYPFCVTLTKSLKEINSKNKSSQSITYDTG